MHVSGVGYVLSVRVEGTVGYLYFILCRHDGSFTITVQRIQDSRSAPQYHSRVSDEQFIQHPTVRAPVNYHHWHNVELSTTFYSLEMVSHLLSVLQLPPAPSVRFKTRHSTLTIHRPMCCLFSSIILSILINTFNSLMKGCILVNPLKGILSLTCSPSA